MFSFQRHWSAAIVIDHLAPEANWRGTFYSITTQLCVRCVPYSCTYGNCDNRYNNKANFMAHMNSHMNVKPYCCITCDKSFSSRSGMKYHQVQCDKSFSSRSGMKYHQVHCGQDKTIICTQKCNKTFRRRANLKEHIHPLKCVQWPVLLGGALGRMFGGSSNFLLTFDRKSMYIGYVLTISWLN